MSENELPNRVRVSEGVRDNPIPLYSQVHLKVCGLYCPYDDYGYLGT